MQSKPCISHLFKKLLEVRRATDFAELDRLEANCSGFISALVVTESISDTEYHDVHDLFSSVVRFRHLELLGLRAPVSVRLWL